ncbi:glycosyltransferase [Vibrio sp. 1CM23M]|uniref:glycosyltransferase n=1 Tax=Vibrio sp. 1CM23M TaxID=2929164 RepID=UPI0020BE29B3|nr:glycosyltransferase [Vibrio sp. 1CM23M]MCK8073695.1 glycosyltransferase [Vibrio sp. 1CM23M]
MDKFSVLMSTYLNDDPYNLHLSMSSLCEQSVKPNEVLLVIDGPIPDENRAILQSFVERLNIKFVQLPNNVGLSNALRIGLEKCNYELVARFDTDDICESTRFEEQLKVFNLGNIDICGSFAEVIDETGVPLGELIVPSSHYDIRKLIWSCPLIHPSVMYRKSKILKIGSYKKNINYRQEDYELWIRAMDDNLIFFNIEKKLIKYRKPHGYYKRNGMSIGINRFKIGVYPWMKYDKRLLSLLALIYPIVRPILSVSIIEFITKKFDPRRR